MIDKKSKGKSVNMDKNYLKLVFSKFFFTTFAPNSFFSPNPSFSSLLNSMVTKSLNSKTIKSHYKRYFNSPTNLSKNSYHLNQDVKN